MWVIRRRREVLRVKIGWNGVIEKRGSRRSAELALVCWLMHTTQDNNKA